METERKVCTMTVNFIYSLPNAEQIGESVYLSSLEESILNILTQGTLDLGAISLGVETVLNQLNLDANRGIFGEYDEWFNEVYQFVYSTLTALENTQALNFILTCYGGVEHTGTSYSNGVLCLVLLGDFNQLIHIQKGLLT